MAVPLSPWHHLVRLRSVEVEPSILLLSLVRLPRTGPDPQPRMASLRLCPTPVILRKHGRGSVTARCTRKRQCAGWRHSYAELTEHDLRCGTGPAWLLVPCLRAQGTNLHFTVAETLTSETKRSSLVILSHKGVLWAAQSDRLFYNLVLPVASAHHCKQERG